MAVTEAAENRNYMKQINWKNILIAIVLVLVPGALAFGVSVLYQRPLNEQIRNTVLVMIGALTLVYAWFHAKSEQDLDYNNALYMNRFAAFFLGGMVLACLLPLFPFPVWPIAALAVALSFFSNTFIGMFSYGVVVMFAVFLAEAPASVFFLYFLSGAAAILLFRHLDESYKVGIPAAISLLYLFVTETASIVLFINERLSWEMFVLPILNLLLTGLLLICVLKYFSFAIIHKYRNRYQEINDPEFGLMAEMKKDAREDYFLALHTAYFSERIASSIHADVALAKAGAYYHRIGKIYREKYQDTSSEAEIIKRICEENEFPPNIQEVLLECAGRKYISKESTIVMFSDAIVSSVLFLLEKEPQKKPDYGQLVDVIFKKKQEKGLINNSSITIHELLVMKQIFVKEKLYYDFLR